MTLIRRSSFSNVANTGTTFDDVFSSTYGSYHIVFERTFAASATDDMQIQLRYAGPTTQASGYFGNTVNVTYDSATITNSTFSNNSGMTIGIDAGGSDTIGSGFVNLYGASGSSAQVKIMGMYSETSAAKNSISWQYINQARTYTGFLVKSSSSNVSGTVAVYGLATA